MIAEDQEQVDKVLEPCWDALPTVESIIFVEPRCLGSMDEDRLMFCDDFM